MTKTKHFNVVPGQNDKFFVTGKMGESDMMLPLTTNKLAKMVARDLNKQLQGYQKEIDNAE